MRTLPVSFVTLAVVVVGALTTTTHARALSCALPSGPIAVFPIDGAAEVPTNAVVFVGTYEGENCAATLGIVDANGTVVPVDGRAIATRMGGLCVLTPHDALSPQTPYELVRFSSQEIDAWDPLSSFTTGDGPDTIPPDVPRDVSSSVTTHGIVSLVVGLPAPPGRSATITFTPAEGALTLAMPWPGALSFDDVEEAASATVDDEILLRSGSCEFALHLNFMGDTDELTLASVDMAGHMSAPVDVTLVAPPPFMTCTCVVGAVDARTPFAGLLVAACALARLRRRERAVASS